LDWQSTPIASHATLIAIKVNFPLLYPNFLICSDFFPTYPRGAPPAMQPQPTATNPPRLPLDRATLANLLQTTLDALPHHPATTPDEIATTREAAVTVIVTLQPRDPMEAILASRIVASHLAAMDCLRHAEQPDLPIELKLRCLDKFASLSRLAAATRQALMETQDRPTRQQAAVPAPIAAPRPQPAPVAALPVAPVKPRPPQPHASPPAFIAQPPVPASLPIPSNFPIPASLPIPANLPIQVSRSIPASRPAPSSLTLPSDRTIPASLPTPASRPPHCAIAATPSPGDAIAQRVLDQIIAHAATAPTAHAA
jgi:hypothetical protein